MHRKIRLTLEEIEALQAKATRRRFELGFSQDPPIGNAINVILDRLGILLVEIPVESEGDKPAFSAIIFCSEEEGESFAFIGINSADYFDKQIFAIAHELYHFFTKSGSHITLQERLEEDLTEAKANWFAAEFLLPEQVLKQQLFAEFKTYSLNATPIRTLLRFIARIHCTWWLPYRSIVKRLWEIDAITEQQYTELYEIDERDLSGEYGRIGLSLQSDLFSKLNEITRTRGTTPKGLENIIRNFEANLIDEETLTTLLNLFARSPEDFGYEISVSQEDIQEINDFIEGWNHED